MTEPKPRPKYNFSKVTYGNPLRIRIINGDRTHAMRALRAAYAWGRRNNKTFFGQTKVCGSGSYMIIYRERERSDDLI